MWSKSFRFAGSRACLNGYFSLEKHIYFHKNPNEHIGGRLCFLSLYLEKNHWKMDHKCKVKIDEILQV